MPTSGARTLRPRHRQAEGLPTVLRGSASYRGRMRAAAGSLGCGAAAARRLLEPAGEHAAAPGPVVPGTFGADAHHTGADATLPIPPTSEPLVIAVHVRRPPADLTRRQAGLLLDGGITRWSQLGPARRAADRHPQAVPPCAASAPDTVAIVPGEQGRARASRVLSVDGRDPLRDPDRLPDPGGRPRARPGHHADRRRRHHARPSGRRPGRGGGRPVVPAPADAAPPALRRHHRRQPREHAVDGGSADPGRRLVRRRPRGAAAACGPRASTRSGLANNHAGDYGERVAGADRRPARPSRTAAVRRGPRPGRRPPAGDRRPARRPLRLRRLQRHRRDPRGRSGPAGRELGQHAAAHRPARPGRARPRARATCADSPAASTW